MEAKLELIERWIKAFGDERYEVSSLGRVRSYVCGNGRGVVPKPRVLNPILQGSGYYMVNIGGKLQKLSRLVMKSFFGDSPLVVNHKNGHKGDDHLDNLEYCTMSENANHAIRTGLSPCGQDHYKAKITKEQALQIFYDDRSQRVIARDFGITQTTVKNIKKKYIWKSLWI